MIASLEVLRDDLHLRSLLREYRHCQTVLPQVEWHDRVMELPKIDAEKLSRLHGYLLASGWIDTRVERESFTPTGQILGSYRLTREGATALRIIEEDIDEESITVH